MADAHRWRAGRGRSDQRGVAGLQRRDGAGRKAASGQSGRGVPAVRNSVYCSSYSAPRSQAAPISTTAASTSAARTRADGGATRQNFLALTNSKHFRASLRPACTRRMVNGVLMQDVFPHSVRRLWQPAISVVVPAFNEAGGLDAFHQRLQLALAGLEKWEVVYVDDGSSDTTLAVMEALRRTDDRVGLVSLSRNFGKEIAITAGLDHAAGDAVVVIDADLQDPPELIPELVAHWRAGFDMVYAKRRSRAGESWMKRATAAMILPPDAAHG